MNLVPSKISFVCSNDNHLTSFSILADEISRSCRDKFIFEFLSLDSYYLQNVNSKRSTLDERYKFRELENPAPLEGNFYHRSPFAIWADVIMNVRPAVKAYWDQSKPDIVVFGNDRGLIEKSLIQEARRRSARSVLIQDGIIGERTESWKYRLKIGAGRIMQAMGLGFLAATRYGEGGCDYLAVYGAAAADLFASRGAERDRILVAGQLRYDVLTRASGPEEAVLEQSDEVELLVTPSALLWALHDRDSHERQLEEIGEIYEAASEAFPDGFHLTVKLHPRESLADYEQLLDQENRQHLTLVQDGDIFKMIGRADYVLTTMSTTWLEAALCKVPCIITNMKFADSKCGRLAIEKDGLYLARERSELVRMLRGLAASDEARKSYCDALFDSISHDVYFVRNETCASRIGKLIESMSPRP